MGLSKIHSLPSPRGDLSKMRFQEMVKHLSLALLAVSLLLNGGCDQGDGKNSSSAGVFLAPVPLAVNEAGVNPQTGESRVDAEFDRDSVLRTVNPNQIGVNPDANPRTVLMGQVSDTEFVFFEEESSTILKADLDKATPLTSADPSATVTRQDLAQLFATAKASFSPNSFLTIFDNVIFGYETNVRSLFVIQNDGPDPDQKLDISILADAQSISQQIRLQAFNFNRAHLLNEVINNATERVAEILLISSVPDQDVQLLVVRQDKITGDITARFRVFDANGVPWPDNTPISPLADVLGFLRMDTVRTVTDNLFVDITQFKPQNIPGEQRVLFYEDSTSNFLMLDVVRDNTSKVIGSIVNLFSQQGEVQFTIRQGTPGDGSDVDLLIEHSFHLPGTTEILAFDENTNNMLKLDYNQPEGFRRVTLYANANDLFLRRDHQVTDDDIEFGLNEPEITFSEGILGDDNLLLFDRGNDQLISLNLTTQLYVVVIKQADLAEVTGLPGISDLTFIRPVTDSEALALDSEGNALVRIRMDYAVFPVFVSNT